MTTIIDTIWFGLERETKGAVLYKELKENKVMVKDFREAHIGSIYLRKSTLGDKIPKFIVVSVMTPNE